MKQPEKWRATIDPFTLSFSVFKLTSILGYSHAGNDIFYVDGIFDGIPCKAFIKVERQKGADILNEAKTIAEIPYCFVPQVLEYSDSSPKYIVTKEAEGERLSIILGGNENLESLKYMKTYGHTHAMFHGLEISCDKVKHRRFFDVPQHDYFSKHGLEQAEEYLLKSVPSGQAECFMHGDFHYANILWVDETISCVLDYELSGIGIKEFDTAWAIFPRPSQRFLKTKQERELFLGGYSELQSFSRCAFDYYFVLIACYFYSMGDVGYQSEVKKIIESFAK